jgi:hypothetical protein
MMSFPRTAPNYPFRKWARLALTDLSVRIMGLGHLDGAAAYEEGRSSSHGLGLVSEK